MGCVLIGVRGVFGRNSCSAPGLVLLLALGACGDPLPSDAEDDATISVTSTLTTAPFSDASGEVQIQIKTCAWTSYSTGSLCAYCPVDTGWVRIGGGAEIDASPSSAQLRASYPFPGPVSPGGSCAGDGSGPSLSAWMARSNGMGVSSHRLRAYVVGLKLAGMTADDLIGGNYVSVNEHTSTASVQPIRDTPPLFAHHVVVAGGAELLSEIFTEPNGFLTELRPIEPPDSNLGWRGAGAFASGSVGSIKVFSIAIDPCLPVPGWNDCLQWKWRTASTGPATGYGTASVATPYPWVTAGVGARGVTAGTSSRYLADIIPLTGTGAHGFTVRTKDQGAAVSGSTKGYAFNFMKGGGLWTYNSIRFNTPGTAFSRPSGTAPVTLQQSIDNPDAAPRRWHLEPMSGGRYRIRHGNPGQGTECARRISGTLDVRVAACGTGDDFLWTTVGAISDGPFKLRNVANSRCIDNNGQGASTSNLVFRTCAEGYNANQSLFLDHYSWPQ